MNILNFIKRQPLLAYFILAFVVSWGSVTILVGPSEILDTKAQTNMLPLVVIIMLIGPGIASILTTTLVDGRTGLRELISRLSKWRVSVRWYATAILITPFSILFSLFILSLFSSKFIPGIFVSTEKFSILSFGLMAGLAGGFL